MKEIFIGSSKEGLEQATQVAAVLSEALDVKPRGTALHFPEKAYEERDGYIAFIKSDKFLDSLRDHPRFEALVQKVFSGI